MRLLDRYLLREFLVPLVYCLSGLELLLITADLFRRLSDFKRKELRLGDILQYYGVFAGEWLGLLLPLALLLALLYALSSHARHNEVTAMRAAGLSLWRISAPYWAVGILASAVLFAINETWSPNSDEKLAQLAQERQPGAVTATGPNQKVNCTFETWGPGRQWRRVWRISSYNERTGEMRDVDIDLWPTKGSKAHDHAARGTWSNGSWTFYDLHEDKQVRVLGTNTVLKSDFFPKATRPFSETPEQIQSAVLINAKKTEHLAGESEIPLLQILNYLRLNPSLSSADAHWLYTKLEGRLAVPWTCLVAVLIAVPFGAASSRRNVYVGVASSILILLGFWLLQQIALRGGTNGWVRPWVAGWVPNGAFALGGLVMTGRVR